MRLWFVTALSFAACQTIDVSRSVGARCDTNADCDVKCLTPSGEWPGGFCTVLCNSSADCPAGSSCIDEQGGVCALSCASDPSCTFLGAGYACQARDSLGAGAKVMVCRGA